MLFPKDCFLVSDIGTSSLFFSHFCKGAMFGRDGRGVMLFLAPLIMKITVFPHVQDYMGVQRRWKMCPFFFGTAFLCANRRDYGDLLLT
jgi:hypothetical protein